jgi:signal transduction histidine kinase
VTEWNDSLGRLLGPAGDTPKRVMPGSCAVRERRGIIVLGVLLFAAYGTSTYLWFGNGAPLLAAFTLCSLIAVAFVCLEVRALEDAQLSATRLRLAELRLARQNSLLQSTLEHMGEGLSVFDNQERLIEWNFRFCELLDISCAYAAGATLRDLLMLQAARGDFAEAETEGEVTRRLDLFYTDVPTTKERMTPAGRVLQIRRCAMPNGAILSVYSDVTEIRASERKLIEARSQAETANRAKGDFLANMSHELRTPLNAIIGFSEVISNELFGPIANAKYREYIKDINTNGLHLLSIVNDVLNIGFLHTPDRETRVRDTQWPGLSRRGAHFPF